MKFACFIWFANKHHMKPQMVAGGLAVVALTISRLQFDSTISCLFLLLYSDPQPHKDYYKFCLEDGAVLHCMHSSQWACFSVVWNKNNTIIAKMLVA